MIGQASETTRGREVRGTLVTFFFALTYLVSWTLWITAGWLSGAEAPDASFVAPVGVLLLLIGTFAPALVAIALTARAEGRSGVSALLGRIAHAPSQARWYVFAVSYMVAIKVGVTLVYRALTASWPQFGDTPWYVVAVAIVFSTPVQAGEEIGWRGYALPRLATVLGLPMASIALGVVWAAWHLPLFFISQGDNRGQSFPLYVLAVTAISVPMAWLYWRTSGSLLLTMLMHAATNNTAAILRSPAVAGGNPFTLRPSLVAWLTTSLLWLAAAFFLVRMRGASPGSESGVRVDRHARAGRSLLT
jgi:CAAX protease family protein